MTSSLSSLTASGGTVQTVSSLVYDVALPMVLGALPGGVSRALAHCFRNPVGFPGDGQIDIIGSGDVNGTEGVSFAFLANGDGSLRAVTSFHMNQEYADDVTTGDLNGDGVIDMVAGGRAGGASFPAARLGITEAGSSSIKISTLEGARRSLDTLETQKAGLGRSLGQVGAMQSRLEVTMRNLSVSREASITAASRIADADIAFETA